MSSFCQKIEDLFPNAVSVPVFLERVDASIKQYGHRPDHALIGLKTCRDDNARDLRLAILQNYPAGYFSLESLAAVAGSPGTTGYGAASHHLPNLNEYGALVLLTFPHIGITKKGEVGKVERILRSEEGSDCGALCAYLAAIQNDPDAAWPDSDPEMQQLGKMMKPYVPEILQGGLVSATYKALDIGVEEQRIMADQVQTHHRGHPILHIGGILINSSNGSYVHQVGPTEYFPAIR